VDLAAAQTIGRETLDRIDHNEIEALLDEIDNAKGDTPE
jgi:hypothetical protein